MSTKTKTRSSDDSSQISNPLLSAALAYAQRGWLVFPVHTPRFSGCSCGFATGVCPQLGMSDHAPANVRCSCTAGAACKNIGKHPRFHEEDLQHGLKDATTDEQQIRVW